MSFWSRNVGAMIELGLQGQFGHFEKEQDIVSVTKPFNILSNDCSMKYMNYFKPSDEF